MRSIFKNIKKSIGVALLLAISFSCNDDLLDKKPLDRYQDEAVWSDPNLVQLFVNSRYNQISHGWAESWMSSVTDETYLIWSRGCEPVTQGYLNPSDLGRMNGAWWYFDNRSWGTKWGNIRGCNLFFENIDEVPFDDEDSKDQLKGEIFFIRALEYFDLVSRWGAMPIVTKTYGLDTWEELVDVERNTYKENVDFIVAQCDSAAKYLPARYSSTEDIGRATSVAALALKSRMLLYSASPLMNKAGVDPLVGYPSPDPDRWQKAADAAKAVIDLATANGYELYNKYEDVKQNYTMLFLEEMNTNNEIIFARQFFGSPEQVPYMDQSNGPNGYGQWGGNVPIQEFVDDFEMADGTPFDWDNPLHASDPYANRDPRLYAYVLSDGDPWMGRNVQTHFYEEMDGGNLVVKGGLDTQEGRDSWNTSTSGYNMRKFLDENYVVNSWNFELGHDWIWFRLGEFYLNYAEAQYFNGNEEEARWGLNQIRERAKMPEVTDSGDELWQRIVNERRVELAFEEHRYFDIRRWMIAEEVMNEPATGIDILKNLDGTYEYTPGRLVENRSFNAPAMYWLPIPRSEMERTQGFKQNPGYSEQ